MQTGYLLIEKNCCVINFLFTRLNESAFTITNDFRKKNTPENLEKSFFHLHGHLRIFFWNFALEFFIKFSQSSIFQLRMSAFALRFMIMCLVPCFAQSVAYVSSHEKLSHWWTARLRDDLILFSQQWFFTLKFPLRFHSWAPSHESKTTSDYMEESVPNTGERSCYRLIYLI